jgi:hypothetical protein
MPPLERIARVCGYGSVALTIALAVCAALHVLGTLRSDALRDIMDAPMAMTFWAYLALTPILSVLGLWFGRKGTRLVTTVKALAGLWLVVSLLLFFLPFAVQSLGN